MVKLQGRWRSAVATPLALAAVLCLPAAPAEGQAGGCQLTLQGDKPGAQLAAQVFERRPRGEWVLVEGPASAISARSGQVLRLSVRPLDGPAQPNGADCPVRVSFGRLTGVARLLTNGGFILDRNVAYGQFRAGEERTLEFEMTPFAEWESANTSAEFDDLRIELPETAEFVERLPAPFRPAAGAVCADVVYPDARPAAGVTLLLAAPPNAAASPRATGADGRVCWEGFDESLYGSLSLDPSFGAALGQPATRYVSREASYRLFVVKGSG